MASGSSRLLPEQCAWRQGPDPVISPGQRGSQTHDVAQLTTTRFNVAIYYGLGLLPRTFSDPTGLSGTTADLEADAPPLPGTPSGRDPKSGLSGLIWPAAIRLAPKYSLKCEFVCKYLKIRHSNF